jgi:hypothetical protein
VKFLYCSFIYIDRKEDRKQDMVSGVLLGIGGALIAAAIAGYVYSMPVVVDYIMSHTPAAAKYDSTKTPNFGLDTPGVPIELASTAMLGGGIALAALGQVSGNKSSDEKYLKKR